MPIADSKRLLRCFDEAVDELEILGLANAQPIVDPQHQKRGHPLRGRRQIENLMAAHFRRQWLDIPDLVTAKVLEAQRAARPFQVAGHGLSQVAPVEVVEPRSRKMLEGCGKAWLPKALAGSRNVAIDEEG